MKMKGQLDSVRPLKEHKPKAKKSGSKKKKKAKLEAQKDIAVLPDVTETAPKDGAEKKTKAPKKIDKDGAAKSTGKPKHLTKLSALQNTSQASLDNAALPQEMDTAKGSRQRASKRLMPMTKDEQLIAINHIIKRLLLDEMTQGEALRELRVDVLGLRQEAYTELTGVSRKTLSEIENDKGNYTAEIVNKVFKPFDLKVGLVPTSNQLLAAILTN